MKHTKEREQESIDKLIDRIDHKYVSMRRNILYPHGEIDLLGKLDNGKYDVYGVKASNHKVARKTGMNQLYRVKKTYPKEINLLFLYTFREDELFLYEPDIDVLFKVDKDTNDTRKHDVNKYKIIK